MTNGSMLLCDTDPDGGYHKYSEVQISPLLYSGNCNVSASSQDETLPLEIRVDVTRTAVGTEDDKTSMKLVLNGNRTVVRFEKVDAGADKLPRCWLDGGGQLDEE
jgi:hypothetical protein